jgi:ribose 5-phosphate isomerase A
MAPHSENLLPLAHRALDFIPPGSVVGLGSGHAAEAFIAELGRCVQDGLQVRGIPTSLASEELARQWHIPLTSLAQVDGVDVDVDGADEVDPHGNLIKGYGGALVREKIIAAAARRVLILVTPEKLVATLGSRGKLPVEVIPFAIPLVLKRLQGMGIPAAARGELRQTYVTQNHNAILDCQIQPCADPYRLELSLRDIPGVVGTGFFLGMANTILIQHESEVETREIQR